MHCQLPQTVAEHPPANLHGPFQLLPPAQLAGHHPVFQPWPFSPRAPPGRGCCSPPCLARTQGNSGPFVSPSCTSLQFMTITFSLPSFLALSQWGFHTLHLIYNCVHGDLLSLRLGNDSLPVLPICSLYAYSFLLTPLTPSVHLPPHLHKMLLLAALFVIPLL